MAYCNQALDFYGNGLSNATYKAALNGRGITDAQLTAGKTGYTNLKAMIPIKAKETVKHSKPHLKEMKLGTILMNGL